MFGPHLFPRRTPSLVVLLWARENLPSGSICFLTDTALQTPPPPPSSGHCLAALGSSALSWAALHLSLPIPPSYSTRHIRSTCTTPPSLTRTTHSDVTSPRSLRPVTLWHAASMAGISSDSFHRPCAATFSTQISTWSANAAPSAHWSDLKGVVHFQMKISL